MDIELESIENLQTYEMKLGGTTITGELTNRSVDGGGAFVYKTDDFLYELNAVELKAIAKKLDELNAI